MADHHHTRVTEDRIQSLVRGIVGEFLSPGNGNDQSIQGQEFQSLGDEINQRFRLPRTAVGISDGHDDTNSPSTSGSGLPLSSITMQPTNPVSQRRPEPFNALANYGVLQQQERSNLAPPPTRQRGRSRVRSSLYSRRRQGSSSSNRSNSKPASDRNELFLKDVCLLPSRSYNKVPRREAKLDLQKRCLYIDAFTFDKRWNEKMLREKIWLLFSTQSSEIELEDNER